MDIDVIDMSGVFISLSVKVPRGVSSKVRYMNCRYKQEIGVIVVNVLAHKGKNIFYNRDTAEAMLPKQYNPKGITNRGIIKALEYLEAEGYVINNIAPRDFGWYDHEAMSSSFIATDKLIDLFSIGRNVINSKQTVVVDTQRVVLKDDSKNTVGYKECDITRYTRDSLSATICKQ